jgi:hypothetical protein
MGVDFDRMIAGSCPGPGLMAKLQKCHQCRDREVLDDPSNTKESFSELPVWSPLAVCNRRNGGSKNDYSKGHFCNRRLIWSPAIRAIASHDQ